MQSVDGRVFNEFGCNSGHQNMFGFFWTELAVSHISRNEVSPSPSSPACFRFSATGVSRLPARNAPFNPHCCRRPNPSQSRWYPAIRVAFHQSPQAADENTQVTDLTPAVSNATIL